MGKRKQTYELFVDGAKIISGFTLRDTMLEAARLADDGIWNWNIAVHGGPHNENIVVEGHPENAPTPTFQGFWTADGVDTGPCSHEHESVGAAWHCTEDKEPRAPRFVTTEVQ